MVNSPRVSAPSLIGLCQAGKIAAAHLFVQLGQFAAYRGLARAKPIRQRCQ